MCRISSSTIRIDRNGDVSVGLIMKKLSEDFVQSVSDAVHIVDVSSEGSSCRLINRQGIVMSATF